MTTERTLLPIGGPGEPERDTPRTPDRPPVATKGKRSFDGRSLRQAGTLLGLSASAYAVSLAAVTGLQAATDRAALAAVEPAHAVLADLVARNERLEANLVVGGGAYQTSADLYDAIVAQLEALERDLSNLQATAGDLSGATKALPQRVTLPRVSSGGVNLPPKVHATTGASGG